jgi:hypothetical protein
VRIQTLQPDECKDAWFQLPGPSPEEKPPLNTEITPRSEIEKGIAWYFRRFRSEGEDWITAYLLIPATTPKPAPAVICPHSTAQGAGKDRTAGR